MKYVERIARYSSLSVRMKIPDPSLSGAGDGGGQGDVSNTQAGDHNQEVSSRHAGNGELALAFQWLQTSLRGIIRTELGCNSNESWRSECRGGACQHRGKNDELHEFQNKRVQSARRLRLRYRHGPDRVFFHQSKKLAHSVPDCQHPTKGQVFCRRGPSKSIGEAKLAGSSFARQDASTSSQATSHSSMFHGPLALETTPSQVVDGTTQFLVTRLRILADPSPIELDLLRWKADWLQIVMGQT